MNDLTFWKKGKGLTATVICIVVVLTLVFVGRLSPVLVGEGGVTRKWYGGSKPIQLSGLAELFKELLLQRFSSSRNGFRLGSTPQETGQTQTHRKTMPGNATVDTREKRLSVSRVDTKNNTADLFTQHLGGLRARALAKELGLRFLDMAGGGTNVDMDDGGTNGNDR